MRILYLTDIRFPIERANGIQTMETAHALARRGLEVSLAVRPDVFKPARDPFDFYGLDRGVPLRILHAPIGGPFWLRRLEYVAWAGWRAGLVRGVDLVFTRDLGVADILRRLPRRLPFVYESHGFAPVFAETLSELVSGAEVASPEKVARLGRRERAVWRAADGYVATTQVLAGELESRFGHRERVSVISNGVRLAAGMLPPARRPGAPVVAYAGHLYPWKGVDVVVEALARVPDARLLVLGGRQGDPDMERIRILAERAGVTSRITMTGFVPKADLAGRLAEADVFVVPTLDTPSARYTSPLKMFEYMSMGRPIVASDLEPVREVLVDGINARLVRPGDPDALAGALRALIDSPDDADRLARRALDDVASRSWDRRAERLERLFAEVLSLTPSGRLTSI